MTLHSVPKYLVDEETGCWNWQLCLNPQTGYGIRTVAQKRWSAHRYAYVQAYGDPGPDYDIHHVCENRACVNPDHLQALLRDEHAAVKGRGQLTREKVVEIRRLRAEGYLQREIAERFGISRVTVSNIDTGKIWKAAA